MNSTAHRKMASIQVLVVDDTPEILEIQVRLLRQMGFSVWAALSPSQAFDHLRDAQDFNAPMLIISDYDLSSTLNGAHLISQALKSGAPVVGAMLVSGRMDLDAISIKLKSECEASQVPFLTLEKPFTAEMLMRSLFLLLGSKNNEGEGPADQFKLPQTGQIEVGNLYSEPAGTVLQNARATLGLSREVLVEVIGKFIPGLTVEQYSAYEDCSAEAEAMPATSWYHLCDIMELPTDILSCGYDYRPHLRRICGSIRKKSFLLPITDHLNHQLSLMKDAQQCSPVVPH